MWRTTDQLHLPTEPRSTGKLHAHGHNAPPAYAPAHGLPRATRAAR
ncbi:MAG TPA: hypothetical protein VGB76_12110 [Pyrinomonadaceae bacterium]